MSFYELLFHLQFLSKEEIEYVFRQINDQLYHNNGTITIKWPIKCEMLYFEIKVDDK